MEQLLRKRQSLLRVPRFIRINSAAMVSAGRGEKEPKGAARPPLRPPGLPRTTHARARICTYTQTAAGARARAHNPANEHGKGGSKERVALLHALRSACSQEEEERSLRQRGFCWWGWRSEGWRSDQQATQTEEGAVLRSNGTGQTCEHVASRVVGRDTCSAAWSSGRLLAPRASWRQICSTRLWSGWSSGSSFPKDSDSKCRAPSSASCSII